VQQGRTGLSGWAFAAADAAMIAAAFGAAFALKKHAVMADPGLEAGPYVRLLAAAGPFVLAALAAQGVYARPALPAGLASQARAIVRASLLAFAVFLAVSFYVKLFSYSRAVFTLFFLLLPPALLVPRLAAAGALRLFGRPPGGARRLLVFGDGPPTRALAGRLAANPWGRCEVAVAEAGDGARSEDLHRIEQGAVDAVVIDLPYEEAATVAEVSGWAEREGVPVYVTPRALPVGGLRPSPPAPGEPLIALTPPALPPAGRIAKRAADVVLSAAGLIAAAPAMALTAALVRLTSRGSAIYSQRRVGLGGRVFTLYKFRTMRDDAEVHTGPVWAADDDARCTPLGRILRRTHLDELPQLWNVLAGDMSLVGPRPERPELVRRFKREVDRYPHKHRVRPGITGWAQIHGWKGPTVLEERIRHDLYYIERWSLALDAEIILRTIFALRRRPVAGVLPPGVLAPPQERQNRFSPPRHQDTKTHQE
jgi:exopolysaccharide biosynthesis polyprenyl glycosylphosphotransferase